MASPGGQAQGPARLDLIVLNAEPLVERAADGKLVPVKALAIETERTVIENFLTASQRPISCEFTFGTAIHLNSALRRGQCATHVSPPHAMLRPIIVLFDVHVWVLVLLPVGRAF